MVLTKRHFEEFARILGKHKADEKMIQDFVDYFKVENPLFDTSRFRKAIKEVV
ncbi:MAG: hypothetical protein ACE5J3_11950 [Methanosarcinales archaeon]